MVGGALVLSPAAAGHEPEKAVVEHSVDHRAPWRAVPKITWGTVATIGDGTLELDTRGGTVTLTTTPETPVVSLDPAGQGGPTVGTPEDLAVGDRVLAFLSWEDGADAAPLALWRLPAPPVEAKPAVTPVEAPAPAEAPAEPPVEAPAPTAVKISGVVSSVDGTTFVVTSRDGTTTTVTTDAETQLGEGCRGEDGRDEGAAAVEVGDLVLVKGTAVGDGTVAADLVLSAYDGHHDGDRDGDWDGDRDGDRGGDWDGHHDGDRDWDGDRDDDRDHDGEEGDRRW